ncbi:ATP-binding protein [Alloscardovia omnicolens]|uniref:ATP-binding protein n=1 Tax=Alloscardovia omnicolens TaxID=419015 RepID=UPI003A5F7109
MRTFFDFLWPGSLFIRSFPSTFTIYLFAYIVVFSRALQWRTWREAPGRWLCFVAFLLMTTVLNGPVLYSVQDHSITVLSYFPLLIQLCLLIAGIHALTRASFVTVIATVAIGYCYEHVVADIVQLIGGFVYNGNLGNFYDNPLFKFFIFLIYCAGGIAMWWCLGRKVEVNDQAIRDRKWWIAACIAVFAFVIFANNFGFALNTHIFDVDSNFALYFSMNVLLHGYDLICSIMVLSVLLLASSRNQIIHEVEVMKDIARRQQQHYEMSQEYRDIINMKMHDMKKFFVSESAHLSQTSPHMVQELQQSLASYDALFHTGSRAVDAILNDKSLYCAQRGITLNCLVDGSALDFMEDADIYSLVGNMMDNAIEAVDSIHTDELSKSISLNIALEGSMVVIRQTNQFSGERDASDGVLKSSKKELYEHGFGMKSMHHVVSSYKGHMSFTTHNHTFNLIIVLPVPFTKS